jgi:hypothetical protein
LALDLFINTHLYFVREKIVTMPRKAEKRHLRRMEKAEKAAQLEKVTVLMFSLSISIILGHIITYTCYCAEH